jgi:hypothetical protein
LKWTSRKGFGELKHYEGLVENSVMIGEGLEKKEFAEEGFGING